MGDLARAMAAIDAANAADPTMIEGDRGREPAELAYGRRMSDELARLHPTASEPLLLAVRGQHIERWTSPRAGYPATRAGYHAWRNALKNMHAERAGAIVAAAGYDAATVARVQSLVRKENLKADAEAQALEDVACLVFLRHYAGAFAAKHDDEKLKTILARTWSKMSAAGHTAALSIDLPPRLAGLLKQVLAG